MPRLCLQIEPNCNKPWSRSEMRNLAAREPPCTTRPEPNRSAGWFRHHHWPNRLKKLISSLKIARRIHSWRIMPFVESIPRTVHTHISCVRLHADTCSDKAMGSCTGASPGQGIRSNRTTVGNSLGPSKSPLVHCSLRSSYASIQNRIECVKEMRAESG